MSKKIKTEAVKKTVVNPPSIPTNHSVSNSNKKICFTQEENGTICILSDNDDDNSTGTVDLMDDNRIDDDDDEDAVMIIEPTLSSSNTRLRRYTEAESTTQGDDEVVAVGDSLMKLPHMRQHCTSHKFISDMRSSPFSQGKILNPKHCDLCYCFVCDVPVKECKQWSSPYYNRDDHCHASDQGPNSYHYKQLRTRAKTSSVTPSPNVISTNSSDFHSNVRSLLLNIDQSSRNANSPLVNSKGPWDPTEGAIKNSHAPLKGCLTQCRRCSYFNKFDHLNFKKALDPVEPTVKAYKIGFKDWCHACGRVASERDFEKVQSKAFVPVMGDVFFGEKVVPFKIKAHDPRKFDDVGALWRENSGKSDWLYDESEMEEDFFRHRIGRRPTLEYILKSIPVKNDVPDISGGLRTDFFRDKVCFTESEALILENKSDKDILMEIYQIIRNDTNVPRAGECIGLDLTANWDKIKRTGTINMKVFLQRDAFIEGRLFPGTLNRFSRILGLWFDIFPFKLSDLTNGLTARELTVLQKKSLPFVDEFGSTTFNSDRVKNYPSEQTLLNYNREAEEISNSLSFRSSSQKKDCGVVAKSDCTFEGVLKSFTSSCLMDNILFRSNRMINYDVVTQTANSNENEVILAHRLLRRHNFRCTLSTSYNIAESSSLLPYLIPEDRCLLHNLKDYARSMSSRCSTMNGLLQQCENLGHPTLDHVDGLTVELFDFQKEAVRWALDRELPGGLEKFLWTELPQKSQLYVTATQTKAHQLYYSPVLDVFRKDQPDDVRGGLIATQMGLGKTVMSLALILLNPAPEFPLSGTKVAEYVPNSIGDSNNSWPNIKPSTGGDSASGTIFSRGTLVVCNVSLVGQWVEEAKSKLKDPGLVYSYYGQNRTRNPLVLAKNAIVVTTYTILQKDVFFHSQKSEKDGYCAPCEQVRWWRIICDESHTVKDSNTKNYKAIERLHAVNKWCVTGTPMNTSPKDLKSQFNLIGISYVNEMFDSFSSTMGAVFRSSGNKRSRTPQHYNLSVGPFLYFMKNSMIRHAISQTGRNSNISIMALPPKSEEVIEIEFSDAERKEYEKIQKNALLLYHVVRTSGKITHQYLRLQSALLPLRLACSGGQLEEGKIHRKSENLELQMDLEGDTECSICLCDIDRPTATSCDPVSHIFCKECIEAVFHGSDTASCPCCRSAVKFSELRSVTPRRADEETENPDKKICKTNKKELGESDIHFRSKFERLLKELSHIRDNEPGSKSLVFSQFSSTLQWMKQELPKYGFQYRTLEGNMSMKKRADALREFRNDPPTTIFLLSIRSGAVGINLTEANRVFLMEPAMNPALEAQAIGRVYRLGQRRPVSIIRMRMKDSFETRLVKVLKRKYNTAKKSDATTSNKDSQAQIVTPQQNASSNEVGAGNSTVNLSDVDNLAKETATSVNNSTAAGNTTVNPSDVENLAKETASSINNSADPSLVENGLIVPELNSAAVGHMSRDKAELMTEEFDALFGLIEPEDLPDEKENGRSFQSLMEESRYNSDDDDDRSNHFYHHRRYDSDDDSRDFDRRGDYDSDDDSRNECTIS